MVRIVPNILIFVALLFINNADGLAVMSIDFGSEYMKIAIVKAGVPMEIVLNKESRRKTPVIVAMKDGERFFSDPAASAAVRFPPKAYWFLHDLIGKKVSNPLVKRFKKRFPYYKIREDEQLGTAIFDHDEKSSYTVEELVAMIFEQAKNAAEDFAEQVIKDCVITVPAFFNQAERRSIIRSAKLANLKVLQLLNDNTAVALNYGVFRRADFNATPVHYMFFDMGASATTATVVSYEVINQKNPVTGYQETFPQVSVNGFGYDRELGGIEMSLRLRDHLADAFNSMKKSKNDVRTNMRSMAKLLKEANRVKHVLSANADHYAQIEGLFEDKDFKFKVTREDVETMCADLFPSVNSVINQALNGTVALADIKEIILMGGATRMPKIQEIIMQATGRQELGKGINTDEAAAMGAVYQAAHLSKGFRVKKFAVKDANHFPIQVSFDRIRTDDQGVVDTKNVKRLIFTPLNPYPQKKVMTFNKNHDDFSFVTGYTKLSNKETSSFDATTLFETTLSGVTDAYKANHVEDSIESKGIKAHFRLDDSGLVNVDSVEMIFERLQDEPEEESTLTMLGNKISSLFSSSETADLNNSTETKDSKKDKPADANATETTNENSTEKNSNSTKEVKPLPVKLKPKIIKVNITSSTTILDLLEPSEAKITASLNVLDGLRKIDLMKAKKEKIMNELESFTVEFSEKLDKDIYQTHSTSEERDVIRKSLSEASDWIYEQEMDTPIETYESKLAELKKASSAVEDRVAAYRELPLAIDSLNEILNYSRTFYANMSNHTVGDNDQPGSKPFTLVERKKLRTLNKDTTKWFKEQQALQAKVKPTELPVLTVGMISLKIQDLDREVKYLLGKAKYFKPLPKPDLKPVNGTKVDANATTSKSNETKSDTTTEIPPITTELPLDEKKEEEDDKKKTHVPEDEL